MRKMSRTRSNRDYCIFAFVALFMLLGSMIFIRFRNARNFRTRSDGKTPSDVTDSVTRRTIVTHVQCIALIQVLNVKWPKIVEAIFEILDAFGSMNTHIASIECSRRQMEDQTQAPASHVGVLYEGAGFMLVLPMMTAILAWVYWVQLAASNSHPSMQATDACGKNQELFRTTRKDPVTASQHLDVTIVYFERQ